ncbi:hypothetical protein [Streptomyces sp. NPDC101150]|uniref:hypothetical protein n=1 Tax=Streptomyces sp. NPDC101150 TaxID=3366114 RepID=UPI0037FEAB39
MPGDGELPGTLRRLGHGGPDKLLRVPVATLLSWISLGLVVAINCVILYSNLTATASVTAAFARKGDPELAHIDVAALLKAAESGFPRWVWILQNARHVIVFGAATLALTTLALT